MKKKFSLLLVLSFIFMAVLTSGVYASGLAINDNRINSVPSGTTMDSDYSFSIKRTDNTSVEFWGYSGKQLVLKRSSIIYKT